MIYVCTKSRVEMVRKNLPSWAATNIQVMLVVERQEAVEYDALLDDHPAGLLILPKSNQGIGYARQSALKDAMERELQVLYMVDDDHALPANFADLRRGVRRYSGIGAYISIYGLYLQMKPNTGIHPYRGNLGQQVIAYDPRKAWKVGGYDSLTDTWEDIDLQIRMLRAGLGSWAINSDVQAKMTGKKWQEGGIQTMGDRDLFVQRAADRMAEKYGADMVKSQQRKGRLFCSINWKEIANG